MVIHAGDVEAQLVAFVRTWFSLLARDDWDAALAMLDEPDSNATRWTRYEITSLVRDTFGPGTRFAAELGAPCFSEPDLATGIAHHSFGEFDVGGFWLDHEVPLNGIFSDLTAQFEFHPRASGFAAILHDLHVL
jgi:hypothetical protein